MDAVRSKLLAFGQEHILEAFPALDETSEIAKQVQSFDIAKIIHTYGEARSVIPDRKAVSPIAPHKIGDFRDPDRKMYFESKGWEALGSSKVGVVILSGGQGTRLGYDGPKGIYDIGLPSHKSIFEIHMDRVRKVRDLAAARRDADGPGATTIPVYIMTSDLNDATIREFFAQNNFFGYPPEDVFFFEQGLEPCLSLDGKLIIDSEESLALAPDGNGGIYHAMKSTGALDDMIARGVEYLHVFGIDNVLTKSADPGFIG